MNLWGHRFSQNAKQKFPDFCFGSLSEGRTEIWKIFVCHFGRNDDLINFFWIQLTFRAYFRNILKALAHFCTSFAKFGLEMALAWSLVVAGCEKKANKVMEIYIKTNFPSVHVLQVRNKLMPHPCSHFGLISILATDCI